MHRNRKRNNWKNQQSKQNSADNKPKGLQFKPTNYINEDTEKEKIKAIEEIKARQIICPKCGQPITDIASSMHDKTSGSPVHFECALGEVSKGEKLGENEKIAYIGQGRFGVLYFENPRDQRNFTIKKIIEWEDREQKPEWRNEISELYSKVN